MSSYKTHKLVQTTALCAVIASVLWASPTHSEAAIVNFSSGNALQHVSPVPWDVTLGSIQFNSRVVGFDERQNVFLNNAVTANAIAAGLYDDTGDLVNVSLSGITVNSHFIHFDPGNSNQSVNDAWFTFDGPIIGVIEKNSDLRNSEFLGHAGNQYPSGLINQGYEFNTDAFSISNDLLTLTVNRVQAGSLGLDQLRVLTVIPEPTTAMLLTAGLVPCLLRKKY